MLKENIYYLIGQPGAGKTKFNKTITHKNQGLVYSLDNSTIFI